MEHLILVTGPSRSGKSEWAERLAIASGRSVVYVATAQVDPADAEWQARIKQHQQRRPPEWDTQHVPLALADTVQTAPATCCLLVDSLGTWVANYLEQSDEQWQAMQVGLLMALKETRGQVILVAEETGWGVVPAYPIGRTFRDRLGTLTRAVGEVAGTVYLVAAGFALNLRTLGQSINDGPYNHPLHESPTQQF